MTMNAMEAAEPVVTEEPEPLDEVATAAYSHLFQALAEPARLTLVQHLASGAHRVRDLVDHLGLAQSTVSKHLAFLVECGLVTLRPEGRSTWYSLAEPELLSRLTGAAEAILQATGTDAVLCTHLRRPHHHRSLPAAAGAAPAHAHAHEVA